MNAGKPSVSVIVACRNEQDTIEPCIREIARCLPQAQIVVVDGGTDRTFEIARGLTAEFPSLAVLKNEDDRGKGHAVRAGIRAAAGDVMAQFDADLQFAADDLPALVAPVVAGACDLCLGSRFLAGADRSDYRPIFVRDAGNRLLSLYVSLLAGRRITDATSGMKAWTRDAIGRIDFRDDRYSYEAEIIVRAAALGLRMREVPVGYGSREHGASMHRGALALAKAGAVIMCKALAARLRGAVPGGRAGPCGSRFSWDWAWRS